MAVVSGRTAVLTVAVVLVGGAWPLLAFVVRRNGLRYHALPRRLGSARRWRRSRATVRADRAFARGHGVSRRR